LFLNQISELDYIESKTGYLEIGATCSLEKILEYPETPEMLKRIILEMASPAIRHQGTLAGNIANASPAGDSLVGLYLYDAEVILRSVRAMRIITVADFITGVRKIDLKSDELIEMVRIPIHNFTKESYTKVGPRKSDAIAKVAFAGATTIFEGRLVDIRFAFGAVYKTVLRSRKIESSLIGLKVKELLQKKTEIVAAYKDLLQPIDDQRSNKTYRLEVALNLLSRFIEDIA
jgi:CO/xanthine dehydrogenase FAD-binding subunit